MSSKLSRRAALAAAATAFVLVAVPWTATRAASLASVDVYNRTAGQALTDHRHRGRRYVEGHPGNEYAVRIRNRTDQRILAVLSVDGVNAVTGETAAPSQAGYVIEPWGYVTVQGWRKDLNRTAAFYFSDPGDSYAARTGRPDDLGVIGVALFRERAPEPLPWWSRDRVAGAAPAPAQEKAARREATGAAAENRSSSQMDAAAAPAAAPPSLGTGHGRGEYSPVEQVAFERASSRPDDVITLRYETREALVAMGVLPRVRWWGGEREPEPFPGSTLGFVPDP